LWWPDEVRRFLRLTASSELRSSPRVSIVAISAMTGIKRKYLYEILIGGSGERGLLRAADAANVGY
jgi:hypothetical protein